MTGSGEPRPLHRERDLGRLVRLMSDAHATGAPPDYLHPGGMQWWFRRVAKDDFTVFVWETGGAIAGWLMDDAGYVIARPAQDTLASRVALIEWAQTHFRAGARTSIELSAADDEPELREWLAAHAYAPSGTTSELLVYDVKGEPPAAALAPGYRLVTLAEVGDAAYVELHRAAWSAVKPSDYSRVLHELVTSAPDFQRDLVPIAVAPDGTPAAYCIAWLDAASGSVEIEPLGTHPAHRRRGLGRAIVREVQRRAWQRGARSVMVWSSHDNAAARRLYTSAEMTPRLMVREYRRAL